MMEAVNQHLSARDGFKPIFDLFYQNGSRTLKAQVATELTFEAFGIFYEK